MKKIWMLRSGGVAMNAAGIQPTASVKNQNSQPLPSSAVTVTALSINATMRNAYQSIVQLCQVSFI